MCITKSELESKVQELRGLKAMKEELENELKAKITYKPQNRTTIDKDKLKDIFGEDLKPFEKVTSYKVLRVK